MQFTIVTYNMYDIEANINSDSYTYNIQTIIL